MAAESSQASPTHRASVDRSEVSAQRAEVAVRTEPDHQPRVRTERDDGRQGDDDVHRELQAAVQTGSERHAQEAPDDTDPVMAAQEIAMAAHSVAAETERVGAAAREHADANGRGPVAHSAAPRAKKTMVDVDDALLDDDAAPQTQNAAWSEAVEMQRREEEAGQEWQSEAEATQSMTRADSLPRLFDINPREVLVSGFAASPPPATADPAQTRPSVQLGGLDDGPLPPLRPTAELVPTVSPGAADGSEGESAERTSGSQSSSVQSTSLQRLLAAGAQRSGSADRRLAKDELLSPAPASKKSPALHIARKKQRALEGALRLGAALTPFWASGEADARDEEEPGDRPASSLSTESLSAERRVELPSPALPIPLEHTPAPAAQQPASLDPEPHPSTLSQPEPEPEPEPEAAHPPVGGAESGVGAEAGLAGMAGVAGVAGETGVEKLALPHDVTGEEGGGAETRERSPRKGGGGKLVDTASVCVGVRSPLIASLPPHEAGQDLLTMLAAGTAPEASAAREADVRVVGSEALSAGPSNPMPSTPPHAERASQPAGSVVRSARGWAAALDMEVSSAHGGSVGSEEMAEEYEQDVDITRGGLTEEEFQALQVPDLFKELFREQY